MQEGHAYVIIQVLELLCIKDLTLPKGSSDLCPQILEGDGLPDKSICTCSPWATLHSQQVIKGFLSHEVSARPMKELETQPLGKSTMFII